MANITIQSILEYNNLIFSDVLVFDSSRAETQTAADGAHFESRTVLRQLLEDFARVFEVSVAVFLGCILILRAGGDEIGQLDVALAIAPMVNCQTGGG